MAYPTQADLRRGVSGAYYALFHLLISETVAHWSLDSSRAGLARMFEHRTMARASDRIPDSRLFPFAGEDPVVADYDHGTEWTHAEALRGVETSRAFSIWPSIRDEKIAQDYLVSLLIRPR